MTPTEPTNRSNPNPSGAELLASLEAMRSAAFVGRCHDETLPGAGLVESIDKDRAAIKAVSDLLARNAELEAERDALAAWKMQAWQARDERDAETKRAAILIAERDALVADNLALREALAIVTDKTDGALAAVAKVAELLAAAERVTAAFRALGRAAPGINSLLAHKECEASMLALSAAIRAMRSES